MSGRPASSHILQDWNKLTIPSLKQNCRDLGLAVGGNKATLIARLEANRGATNAVTFASQQCSQNAEPGTPIAAISTVSRKDINTSSSGEPAVRHMNAAISCSSTASIKSNELLEGDADNPCNFIIDDVENRDAAVPLVVSGDRPFEITTTSGSTQQVNQWNDSSRDVSISSSLADGNVQAKDAPAADAVNTHTGRKSSVMTPATMKSTGKRTDDSHVQTNQDLTKLTIPALKRYCRDRGLAVGGNKQTLLDRINAYHRATTTVASDAEFRPSTISYQVPIPKISATPAIRRASNTDVARQSILASPIPGTSIDSQPSVFSSTQSPSSAHASLTSVAVLNSANTQKADAVVEVDISDVAVHMIQEQIVPLAASEPIAGAALYSSVAGEAPLANDINNTVFTLGETQASLVESTGVSKEPSSHNDETSAPLTAESPHGWTVSIRDSTTAPSFQDWSKMTIATLKQHCRDSGLAVSGNKVVLIDRLEAYYGTSTRNATIAYEGQSERVAPSSSTTINNLSPGDSSANRVQTHDSSPMKTHGVTRLRITDHENTDITGEKVTPLKAVQDKVAVKSMRPTNNTSISTPTTKKRKAPEFLLPRQGFSRSNTNKSAAVGSMDVTVRGSQKRDIPMSKFMKFVNLQGRQSPTSAFDLNPTDSVENLPSKSTSDAHGKFRPAKKFRALVPKVNVDVAAGTGDLTMATNCQTASAVADSVVLNPLTDLKSSFLWKRATCDATSQTVAGIRRSLVPDAPYELSSDVVLKYQVAKRVVIHRVALHVGYSLQIPEDVESSQELDTTIDLQVGKVIDETCVREVQVFKGCDVAVVTLGKDSKKYWVVKETGEVIGLTEKTALSSKFERYTYQPKSMENQVYKRLLETVSPQAEGFIQNIHPKVTTSNHKRSIAARFILANVEGITCVMEDHKQQKNCGSSEARVQRTFESRLLLRYHLQPVLWVDDHQAHNDLALVGAGQTYTVLKDCGIIVGGGDIEGEGGMVGNAGMSGVWAKILN